MMEIAEAYSIARQLRNVVIGKKIKSVEIGYLPHKFAFFSEDIDIYNKLIGKTIVDITSVGGQVDFILKDYHLLVGDGTSIRYFDKDIKLPEKRQLSIEFEDETKIVCSVQMYGSMIVFKEGEYNNFYYRVAKEKSTPLSDEFTMEYFENMLKNTKKNLSVKALLATEQRIPGLGNGTLQDILFSAGINPQRKIELLSTKETENIFYSVKNTINTMAKEGGRDTEKDIYGEAGKYKTILSNKTYKLPCRKCNGEIIKKAYLGGTVYFCPVCQPVNK